MCLNVAKSSDRQEEERLHWNITLYQCLCVVVGYLIVFALVNGRLLGEGGANLPLCTEYAEFMHLKLIT